MNKEIEEIIYSPETTDALIDAFPKNPYDPCPCGCGIKWRYVVRDGEIEKHAVKFCNDYEEKLKEKEK